VRSDEAEQIALDLSSKSSYYDLIYKDLDGRWKKINLGLGTGRKIARESEILEQLKEYRKGREDWNLKAALFAVDVQVFPCNIE
jgi:hypothetical protein